MRGSGHGRGDGLSGNSSCGKARVIEPEKPMEAPVYVRRKSGHLEPMDNRVVSLTAL